MTYSSKDSHGIWCFVSGLFLKCIQCTCSKYIPFKNYTFARGVCIRYQIYHSFTKYSEFSKINFHLYQTSSLEFIKPEVDQTWNWSSFELIKLELVDSGVDQAGSWPNLGLIKPEVDQAWNWPSLDLINKTQFTHIGSQVCGVTKTTPL
jgi:hypothetical protein